MSCSSHRDLISRAEGQVKAIEQAKPESWRDVAIWHGKLDRRAPYFCCSRQNDADLQPCQLSVSKIDCSTFQVDDLLRFERAYPDLQPSEAVLPPSELSRPAALRRPAGPGDCARRRSSSISAVASSAGVRRDPATAVSHAPIARASVRPKLRNPPR